MGKGLPKDQSCENFQTDFSWESVSAKKVLESSLLHLKCFNEAEGRLSNGQMLVQIAGKTVHFLQLQCIKERMSNLLTCKVFAGLQC